MSSEEKDLEQLLAEMAPDESARDVLREAHRQLEKDLLRLADPLPPADFLNRVMTKVNAAPVPMSRADMLTAAAIVSAALLGAVVVLGPASLGSVGLAIGSVVVALREGIVAFGSVVSAVWKTASMPVAVVVSLMFAGGIAVLRRLASPSTAATRVVS